MFLTSCKDFEMKRQELENRIVILQARVRGYLVRKKLSSLREEYENIVREIEGDLALLEWCGETIQRPVFVNKKRAVSQATSCTAAEEPAEDHSSAARTNKTTCRTSEMLQPERDTDGATLFAVEQHPREERAVPELLSEGARHVPESASASVSELSGSAEEEERDLRSCTDLTSVWNSTTQDSGSSVIHKVFVPEANPGNSRAIEGCCTCVGVSIAPSQIHPTLQRTADSVSVWFPDTARRLELRFLELSKPLFNYGCRSKMLQP
ncbi:IQ domain-containing protein C-like isoform X1 [Acipenser ruthenus]|uniref:IQ domain-containing protein C-like isoform X1 n=1 Tax=Acipenser ruthenus TaxID=7906 RepID=UPI00274193F1|nr:IQ domain-containing protein C-like isoform X1 [Acipenser ruthenus]